MKILLICASLGSIYGLEVGSTEGNELCLSDGTVIRRRTGTYNGTELGLS